MDEFVRTGSDLKNAKLIIIDARSNSGGDEDFIKNWLKSYTGEEPEQKTIISNWGTAMFDRIQAYADLGEEFAMKKSRSHVHSEMAVTYRQIYEELGNEMEGEQK